jgi:hypothetical protein
MMQLAGFSFLFFWPKQINAGYFFSNFLYSSPASESTRNPKGLSRLLDFSNSEDFTPPPAFPPPPPPPPMATSDVPMETENKNSSPTNMSVSEPNLTASEASAVSLLETFAAVARYIIFLVKSL